MLANKESWFVQWKLQPDVVGHPGIFGILHFTHYILGHTKSFFGVPNSTIVLVLKCRDGLFQAEKALV